jgi:PBP1b-binding outer membrane lipoprotein LpoB
MQRLIIAALLSAFVLSGCANLSNPASGASAQGDPQTNARPHPAVTDRGLF